MNSVENLLEPVKEEKNDGRRNIVIFMRHQLGQRCKILESRKFLNKWEMRKRGQRGC